MAREIHDLLERASPPFKQKTAVTRCDHGRLRPTAHSTVGYATRSTWLGRPCWESPGFNASVEDLTVFFNCRCGCGAYCFYMQPRGFVGYGKSKSAIIHIVDRGTKTGCKYLGRGNCISVCTSSGMARLCQRGAYSLPRRDMHNRQKYTFAAEPDGIDAQANAV